MQSIYKALEAKWLQAAIFAITIITSDLENIIKNFKGISKGFMEFHYDTGNIIVGIMLGVIIIGYARTKVIQAKNEKLINKIQFFITVLQLQNDVRHKMSKGTAPVDPNVEKEELKKVLDKRFGIDLSSMNEPIGRMGIHQRDYVLNCLYGNWNYWVEDDNYRYYFEDYKKIL